jgi:hypothetical protein
MERDALFDRMANGRRTLIAVLGKCQVVTEVRQRMHLRCMLRNQQGQREKYVAQSAAHCS